MPHMAAYGNPVVTRQRGRCGPVLDHACASCLRRGPLSEPHLTSCPTCAQVSGLTPEDASRSTAMLCAPASRFAQNHGCIRCKESLHPCIPPNALHLALASWLCHTACVASNPCSSKCPQNCHAPLTKMPADALVVACCMCCICQFLLFLCGDRYDRAQTCPPTPAHVRHRRWRCSPEWRQRHLRTCRDVQHRQQCMG